MSWRPSPIRRARSFAPAGAQRRPSTMRPRWSTPWPFRRKIGRLALKSGASLALLVTLPPRRRAAMMLRYGWGG